MCNVNSDACRQSEGVVMRPPISPTSVDLFMDNWERILSSIFSDNSQICWWHIHNFTVSCYWYISWLLECPYRIYRIFLQTEVSVGNLEKLDCVMFQHVDETLAIYINEKPTNSLKEWSSWAWAWYDLNWSSSKCNLQQRKGWEMILTNPLTF